jgi:hypothetical protein
MAMLWYPTCSVGSGSVCTWGTTALAASHRSRAAFISGFRSVSSAMRLAKSSLFSSPARLGEVTRGVPARIAASISVV